MEDKSINIIKINGKAIQFFKKHPFVSGFIISSSLILKGIPLALLLIGFGPGGIVVGTSAAAIMKVLGSGSIIVGLAQSIGATGSLLDNNGKGGVAASIVIIGTSTYVVGKIIQKIDNESSDEIKINVLKSKL